MIIISKPKPDEAREIHTVIKESYYSTYINDDIGITKKDIDMIYEDDVVSQIQAIKNRAKHPIKDDISLVAKDELKIVGIIRFKIHLNNIELRTLYILPNYFNLGIGTKLWKEALKILPKNKSITVEVSSYTKAVDFYKKNRIY